MGAQTRRSLGHHVLHPRILRLLVLLPPVDFEAQCSIAVTDCTRRSKFLTHALTLISIPFKVKNASFQLLYKVQALDVLTTLLSLTCIQAHLYPESLVRHSKI